MNPHMICPYHINPRTLNLSCIQNIAYLESKVCTQRGYVPFVKFYLFIQFIFSVHKIKEIKNYDS